MTDKGFSRNFLVLFSGNSIGQLLPFLFGPFIGRLFTDEDQAIFANFLALSGMISIIGSARYEKAIVLPKQKDKAMNLVSLSIRIILVVSILSCLLYVFRYPIDSFYEKGKMSEYMYLVVLAIPIYAAANLMSEWLIRNRKFKSITYTGIARSAFISIFTILFGYVSFGASGLILGTIVGLLIYLVLMIIASYTEFDFSLVSRNGRLEVAKEFKDFPLINSAHAFADILFGQFIVYWIITKNYGLAELGIYSFMVRYLMASMRAVGQSTGQLYYREASELASKGLVAFSALVKSIKLVLLFAIPISIIVGLFGPTLFEWYFGLEFRASGEIAQIMIIPIFLSFITSPISSTPIIYRKQALAFAVSLIGYVSMILCFVLGDFLKWSFYDALKLVAITQTLYYSCLIIWYIQLSKKSL